MKTQEPKTQAEIGFTSDAEGNFFMMESGKKVPILRLTENVALLHLGNEIDEQLSRVKTMLKASETLLLSSQYFDKDQLEDRVYEPVMQLVTDALEALEATGEYKLQHCNDPKTYVAKIEHLIEIKYDR